MKGRARSPRAGRAAAAGLAARVAAAMFAWVLATGAGGVAAQPAEATGAAASAATGGAIEVHDDRGRRLRLAAPPARIVSLLPSLTEAVCALGGCDRLVGVDRHSNWPESVVQLPRLGGLDDTPLERVLALRPDVVLAARSHRIVARLEALGVAVLTLEPQDEADLSRTLDALATLLGRPAEAAALRQRMAREVDAQAARLGAAWRGRRVYFEVGAGPYAAGAASFVGQLFARLGLANVVPAERGAFPKLNPEFVVRARPQVLLAARREWPDLRRRPGWGDMVRAAAATCELDPAAMDVLVRPGPRQGDAARVVVQCLVAAEGARETSR